MATSGKMDLIGFIDGDNLEYGRYVRRDRKDGLFTQLQPSDAEDVTDYWDEWDYYAENYDHTSNSFRYRERQIALREKSQDQSPNH